MFCPYCRQQLKDTDNYCTRCGRRLPELRPRADAPVPAQRPTPAPARQPAPVRQPAPAPQPPIVVQQPLPAQQPAPQPAPAAAARPASRPKADAATVVLTVAACLLGAAFVAVCACVPLLRVLPLTDAQGNGGAIVQTVLGAVDPAVSLAASGLVGDVRLTALEAVRAGTSLADATGSTQAALAVGLAAGAAAAAVVLVCAGVLSVLACRRPTPLLCWGGGVALVVAGAGLALLGTLDAFLVSGLRNSFSHTFAEQGIQLPAAAQILQVQPGLVALAALSFACLVCALAARVRWTRSMRAGAPGRP